MPFAKSQEALEKRPVPYKNLAVGAAMNIFQGGVNS